jgi:hypothetical protein
VIGESAFSSCSSLRSICIPSSVKTLCDVCLSAAGLSSVTFESGSQLSTLGSGVFLDCTSLLPIHLPSGISEIGGAIAVHLKNSFESINDRFILRGDFFLNLRSKTIIQYFGEQDEVDVFRVLGEVGPELRVVRLGPYSFAENSILKSICIPSSVEIVCEYCFCDCKNLSSAIFEIGCKISVIEKRAFWGCESLKSIRIPATVTTLGEDCFAACKSLSSVLFEIGCKISVIEKCAFCDCESLISIRIPATVTTLGEGCFKSCNILSTLIFESGSKLDSIEAEVFSGCLSLSSIYIPASLETILEEYQEYLKVDREESTEGAVGD